MWYCSPGALAVLGLAPAQAGQTVSTGSSTSYFGCKCRSALQPRTNQDAQNNKVSPNLQSPYFPSSLTPSRPTLNPWTNTNTRRSDLCWNYPWRINCSLLECFLAGVAVDGLGALGPFRPPPMPQAQHPSIVVTPLCHSHAGALASGYQRDESTTR